MFKDVFIIANKQLQGSKLVLLLAYYLFLSTINYLVLIFPYMNFIIK